jgi:hypothetical protein
VVVIRGFSLADSFLQSPQLPMPIEDVVQSGSVTMANFLSHMSDSGVARHTDLARFRGNLSKQQGKKTRLPAAVTTDQGCPSTGEDNQRGLLEKIVAAPLQGYVVQRNQGLFGRLKMSLGRSGSGTDGAAAMILGFGEKVRSLQTISRKRPMHDS